MTNQELQKYRIGLFRDAFKMEKKPDRTPQLSNFWTWKILDSGYNLREAFDSFDIMEKSVMDFQNRYQFDFLMDAGTRNTIALAETLGSSVYEIDDEKNIMNIRDNMPMDFEDYDALIENYPKFLWQTLLPKRYPRFNSDLTVDEFKKTVMAFLAYGQYSQKVTARLKDECGVPPIPTPAVGGFDYLFNMIRGIKGLSYDMRKDPGKVKAATEVIDAYMTDPILEGLKANPGPDNNYAFDIYSASLGHTIVNRKQWEAYIWPFYKKIIDVAVKADKTIFIFTEGSTERFWEYFREIPKGYVAIHVEQDDIFKARKELPNICLSGGMPASLLSGGTPQACVDYAKRLIDEVGGDGGFILSQDKMISYRNDCRRENLEAVCNFVREYRS